MSNTAVKPFKTYLEQMPTPEDGGLTYSKDSPPTKVEHSSSLLMHAAFADYLVQQETPNFEDELTFNAAGVEPSMPFINQVSSSLISLSNLIDA